jgi:hypothetical protein
MRLSEPSFTMLTSEAGALIVTFRRHTLLPLDGDLEAVPGAGAPALARFGNEKRQVASHWVGVETHLLDPEWYAFA